MRLVIPRVVGDALPLEVGRPQSLIGEYFPDNAATKEADPISDDLLRAHGGSLYRPNQPGCDYFAFQNVRGIERFPHPAEEAISAMMDLDLGFFGVAEPNCAFDDDISTAIDARLKKCFGCGFAEGASSTKSHSGYLAGGTMNMLRGGLVDRHMKIGTDRDGRFAWSILRGKNDKKLCVITGYRVTQ